MHVPFVLATWKNAALYLTQRGILLRHGHILYCTRQKYERLAYDPRATVRERKEQGL